MREANGKGLVVNMGVAINTPQQALDAIRTGSDYVQIPYNVFDRRLDRVGFFDRAEERRVTVVARSPLLQGLIIMDPAKAPAHLSQAVPHLKRFRSIATEYGLSPLEAAFLYVNAHPGIDRIVFGVETLPQLKEILSAATREASRSCVVELREAFMGVEELIVNPTHWKKEP